ncbi:tRNA (guanosine(37)-N1)-methyltransferase TrmD [Corynebacterium mendelii]|uniref:tRNA (guanine-N(1)-)-methyltransferase n=1 Tax=Corynebacterium mendelii TaxID=2765362 RepID=A0A939DYH4_9CORY|nr:tRNA (guanosine(37)-N1)-methyltransferase TrmD [Corynebacterium mendelii]MBN9643181.1 tRNA (guanosine(37)-N1)-methyltransferase TrmD [Corynebacterium mendelii]
MRIDVVTIFPGYFEPLRHALVAKAVEKNLLEVYIHNLRQWATGNHKSVDDSPCGGGPGMVMTPTVWGPALDDVAAGTGPVSTACRLTSAAPHANKPRHDDLSGTGFSGYTDTAWIDPARGEAPCDGDKPVLVVPTPAGSPFTQEQARQLAAEKHLVFACGRYEGIDQRVIDEAAARYRVREVSIGDYVLIGGEVAVLVIAEAVVRLIPGVLGNATSHEQDSFSDGLVEGPCYTKPARWRGRDVPEVLLSGNHALIDTWRREQSLRRTLSVRPDIIDRLADDNALSTDDLEYLAQLADDAEHHS